jgi:hypothetical protein
MYFDRKGITDRRLIKIYKELLIPRMIEEKMLKLLRQGKISYPVELPEIKPETTKKNKKRLVDAVADGLDLACEKYPQLILMGQDIAEYGGVFNVTEGLVNKYGKERIRNTPVPFTKNLEDNFLPVKRFKKKLTQLLEY